MLKEKKIILALLWCCLSLFFNTLAAQSTVKASIKPLEISIGQQATLQIDVTSKKGTKVNFPIFEGELIPGIEIIAPVGIDTTFENGLENLSLKYVITSFDSALYHIPFIPVIINTDTLKSNDLALKVISPQLTEATLAYIKEFTENKNDSIPNFEKLGINDIKPILESPFAWLDYLMYIMTGIFIIILLAIIILGIYFWNQKKKRGYFFKPKVILPPHIIALKELDTIKEEKLWQQGREKLYYTNLSEILREYIEKRFGINAFEMTSDEVMQATKYILEDEESLRKLNQILKLSDLVKFAKYKPLSDENDLSLTNAYSFVTLTKKEEELPLEEKKTTEKSSKKIIRKNK